MAERPRSLWERWFGRPKPPASLERGMQVLQDHIACLEARAGALAALENDTAARVRSLHSKWPDDARVIHAFTELLALQRQTADVSRARALLSQRLYGLQGVELAQMNVVALGRVRSALGRSVEPDMVVDLDTALSDLVADTDDTAGLSALYGSDPEPDVAAGLAEFLRGGEPHSTPMEVLPAVPVTPPTHAENPVAKWLKEEA